MQKDHQCNHFRTVIHIIGLKIHFLGCVLREPAAEEGAVVEKGRKARALN